MITLSQKDTYKLLYLNNKFNTINKRYKFKTLHQWWCLNCSKEIFIRYDTIGLPNIFCKDEECQKKAMIPTIVQYQYLKRLKDEQLKLFNNIK